MLERVGLPSIDNAQKCIRAKGTFIFERAAMATIYKRNKKKNTVWEIQYKDHEGNRRACKGFTDKGLTEQLAAKLEAEARMRRTGMIDPEQEKFLNYKQSPLQAHLDAFKLSLGDNSEKHVKLTMTRVNRIVDECEFEKLAEITTEIVQQCLRDARDEDGFGHRTYNHYIQAFDSFMNWCVTSKRLLVNPIMGMERMNVETDVRHKRRALLPDETQKLIDSARQSGVSIQCFDGEQRARIYILSYMTGLRRNEIASLTPRSFDLKSQQPTLTVEAKSSKHKKKDVLPLHHDFVEVVSGWIKGMALGDKLFPKLGNRRTWLMVKKDLERVGIPYENDDGIADFHAAGRHTHITELFRNGATVPEAQKLARHSDVKQTMKYTHIGLSDQAKALGKLPTSLLHRCCISGVSDGHSVTTPVTGSIPKECQNPENSQGFDTDCQSMASADNLEAAGIEPAASEVDCAVRRVSVTRFDDFRIVAAANSE
jgi:integrase